MTRSLPRNILFAVILLTLAIFLIWPILLTLGGAFGSWEGASFGEKIASFFRYFTSPKVGVLRDPLYLAGLWNSLAIATCTTAVCLFFTMPLAILASRFEFPGKAFLTSFVLVPLILPPFVGAIGMRAILGRFGALNALLTHLHVISANQPGIGFLGGAGGGAGRFWSVVLMEALHLYPILFLNITAAMANLDPALEEAALGSGAGRWWRFFRITFPLILPGVFAGSTLVYIWSFTELGTPLMFDFYTVMPVQIFWGVQEVAANPRPYALVVVMLVMSVGLYMLGKFAFGGRADEMQSKASIRASTTQLKGLRGIGAAAAFVVLIGLAILPHLGVILASFSEDGAWYRTVLPTRWTGVNYTNALSHPLAIGSIRNSLIYASAAMVVCVVMGIAISYLVVRAKVRGGWLLDHLSMLPLAVPGLVMAFGYVSMSLTWPFKGGMPGWIYSSLFWVFDNARFWSVIWPDHWLAPHLSPWLASCVNIQHAFQAVINWINNEPLSAFQIVGSLPNPIPILIIAYALRRLPYVVRAASAGLEQTSGQLEEAALNLGASRLTAIRRVVLPLIAANIIAGAILAFSFAMLEVSDSLILAQREQHYPITKAIFEFYNRLGDGPYIASAMGVWAMALLTVTLVGAGLMMGKRMGAIFRA